MVLQHTFTSTRESALVASPPTRLSRPLCLVVGRGHGSAAAPVLPQLMDALPVELQTIGKMGPCARLLVGLGARPLES